jgi:hypothetical protein
MAAPGTKGNLRLSDYVGSEGTGQEYERTEVPSHHRVASLDVLDFVGTFR